MISSVSSRFKSLLQNRPAAENTCIEISHVKYNIFHVRILFHHLLLSNNNPKSKTNNAANSESSTRPLLISIIESLKKSDNDINT